MKVTYEPPDGMSAVFTKDEVSIIDTNYEGKWGKFVKDKMKSGDYEMNWNGYNP